MSEHQESKDEDIQNQESKDEDTQEEVMVNSQNRRWRWRPVRRPGQESGEWEEEMNIIVPNVNVAISILNALISPDDSPFIPQSPLYEQILQSSPHTPLYEQILQSSPPHTPPHTSLQQTEGSLRQTEGSLQQTEGSLWQTPPRRIRQRDEDETIVEQNKSLKVTRNKKIVKKRINQYSYLLLKSGHEFHFNKEDGKNILLTNEMEPNRLIRNIISRVPHSLKDRLKYLAKFESEEESDSESSSNSDCSKKNENENENHKKVEKRYFGNLKELVYEAYIKEERLRFLFKRVLSLWRVHVMDKKCEIGLDPITLAEPVKKVYVYDWPNKKKFVFDAKSLAMLIESRLTYPEYGFSMPQHPKNPNNNVEFSSEQLVSIYFQLKDYGELRWGFTTLKEYDFKINRWVMYHKSALTLNSIRKSISLLDTNEDRELFSDFIFAKLEKLQFRTTVTTNNYYITAMIKDPKHWYLEKLKSLAISHYEAEHFGYYVDDYVDDECTKIFQKQAKFFKDLRTRKLI